MTEGLNVSRVTAFVARRSTFNCSVCGIQLLGLFN